MAADSYVTKHATVTMTGGSVAAANGVATKMATTSTTADLIATKLTSGSVTSSTRTEQYGPERVQSASAPTRHTRDSGTAAATGVYTPPDSSEVRGPVEDDHDWRHGRHGVTDNAKVNVFTQLSVLGQAANVLSMLTEYTRYNDQVWQHVYALLELVNFVAAEERDLTDDVTHTGRTGGILEALTTLSCMLVGVLGAKHHSARHKKLVDGHRAVADATAFVLSLEPGAVPVADTVPGAGNVASPCTDRTATASVTSPRTASNCGTSADVRVDVEDDAIYAPVARDVPRALRNFDTAALDVDVHVDHTATNPGFGASDYDDDVERQTQAAEESFRRRHSCVTPAHRKSRCTPFQILQQCSIGTSQRFRLGNDSNPVMTIADPSQVHGFASIASVHGRAYLIVGVGSTPPGAKQSIVPSTVRQRHTGERRLRQSY